MNKITQGLISLACLALASTAVLAEDKALDRAQFMLRQINAQKVQLEQENAKLKAELDELRKQSEKQLRVQKSGNDKLDQSLKKKEAYIGGLKDKLREIYQALRQSENERLQANRMSQSLDTDMQRCVHNNHELVKLNDQLVELYEDKGMWDSFAQSEPFTGIRQVEIENIMQEYRFANEDLKVNSTTEYKQVGDTESRVPETDLDG